MTGNSRRSPLADKIALKRRRLLFISFLFQTLPDLSILLKKLIASKIYKKIKTKKCKLKKFKFKKKKEANKIDPFALLNKSLRKRETNTKPETKRELFHKFPPGR